MLSVTGRWSKITIDCLAALGIDSVMFAVSLWLQHIMKDQWVNIGYEDDKLKPFAEPPLTLDQKRIGTLVGQCHVHFPVLCWLQYY